MIDIYFLAEGAGDAVFVMGDAVEVLGRTLLARAKSEIRYHLTCFRLLAF